MYHRLTSSSTLLNLAQALTYHKTYGLPLIPVLATLIFQHVYYLFGMTLAIEQTIQSNFPTYCLRHVCLFENHINQRTTMHEHASVQDVLNLKCYHILIVCSSFLSLNAEACLQTYLFFYCHFCLFTHLFE